MAEVAARFAAIIALMQRTRTAMEANDLFAKLVLGGDDDRAVCTAYVMRMRKLGAKPLDFDLLLENGEHFNPATLGEAFNRLEEQYPKEGD